MSVTVSLWSCNLIAVSVCRRIRSSRMLPWQLRKYSSSNRAILNGSDQSNNALQVKIVCESNVVVVFFEH